MQINNKQAMVTGGSQRVGARIALNLARLGYDILIHYNSSQDKAIDLQEQVKKNNVKCFIFKANLFDMAEVAKLFDYAIEKLPGLDLIINNASIFNKISHDNTTIDDIDRNFSLHFKAPFLLTQLLARHKDKKANVINIIDNAITGCNPEYFAYLLSKKCLFELTRMQARVLGPNIRVNAIAPGSIYTPIDDTDSSYMTKRANMVPLKMAGNVDYINTGIEYLLNNPFVTGQCLFIDGGAELLKD